MHGVQRPGQRIKCDDVLWKHEGKQIETGEKRMGVRGKNLRFLFTYLYSLFIAKFYVFLFSVIAVNQTAE